MKDRTVAEVMAHLEAQVELFRERQAWHAQQEDYHRGEQTRYAAELETVSRHLEAFRSAADLAGRDLGEAVPSAHEDLGSASRPKLARMVERVLADHSPDAPFGTKWVTQEVSRRFGSRLRKAVNERRISVVLRRFHRTGRLHLVRAGRPHWEALYVRKA